MHKCNEMFIFQIFFPFLENASNVIKKSLFSVYEKECILAQATLESLCHNSMRSNKMHALPQTNQPKWISCFIRFEKYKPRTQSQTKKYHVTGVSQNRWRTISLLSWILSTAFAPASLLHLCFYAFLINMI